MISLTMMIVGGLIEFVGVYFKLFSNGELLICTLVWTNGLLVAGMIDDRRAWLEEIREILKNVRKEPKE